MQACSSYQPNECSHDHVHIVLVREGRYFSATVLARIICDECLAVLDEKRLTRSTTWNVG